MTEAVVSPSEARPSKHDVLEIGAIYDDGILWSYGQRRDVDHEVVSLEKKDFVL